MHDKLAHGELLLSSTICNISKVVRLLFCCQKPGNFQIKYNVLSDESRLSWISRMRASALFPVRTTTRESSVKGTFLLPPTLLKAMFPSHRPKTYRSRLGCCICGAKSSSSRFTSSLKYETHFAGCFRLNAKREGEICNACVLLVKRWKKLPQSSAKNWKHVSTR